MIIVLRQMQQHNSQMWLRKKSTRSNSSEVRDFQVSTNQEATEDSSPDTQKSKSLEVDGLSTSVDLMSDSFDEAGSTFEQTIVNLQDESQTINFPNELSHIVEKLEESIVESVSEINANVSSEIGPHEEIPVYENIRELRQGPWFHPYPIIVGLAIVGLLISLLLANLQINRLSDELDKTDFFHSPPNLAQLIKRVQESTMVVRCGDSLGSGWVISLGEVISTADEATKKLDKAFPGSVITNYHVIANCINAPNSVTTSNGGKYYEAVLFSYDRENDLAIVSTKLVLPFLEISKQPSPGWWSMALGSPYGIEKSISIGNIMNIVGQEIISTAPINPGNSGGPLVNSFGEVIGTNTWKLRDASGVNVAKSAQLLCDKLVVCNSPIW